MAVKFGIFDWVEASSRPAHEVYEHKLALAAAADAAGFHAFMVAEHQGTPLSMDGSPSLLLSAMFQRTRRLRAGALTFCLPWYDPFRFYNEVSMLDQMSGGRLELGVGRGVSPIESRIFGLKSAEESRERYRETLDVFFQACRTDILRFRDEDIQLQVKPLQKPYPPLWFPSSNRDGIDFTARHGYHTAFLGRLADARPHFERYREVWAKHRNDPGRHNAHVAEPFLAKTQHLVIAETDAEAEKLGLEAYWKWAGHLHHLTRARGLPDVHKNDPYAEDSSHRLIAGSPRTVAEKLAEMVGHTSINYLLCIFSFGDLAPAHAMRSLALFAREVMPALASDRVG
jgi:alkanesulfonate monooxygenase SsuD/methylene tetrahydromethanopterin reductase-like flavin-dependent oxidoreductase (luciferase family)